MFKIILQSLKNLEYYLEDLEIVWKKKLKSASLTLTFFRHNTLWPKFPNFAQKLWVVFSSKIRQIVRVLMNLNQFYIDLWGKIPDDFDFWTQIGISGNIEYD